MTVVLGPTTGVSTAQVVPSVIGNHSMILSAITFSSTYKTGGDESLLALLEGLFKLEGVGVIQYVNVTGITSHYPVYNYETNKLMFLVASTGVELAEAAYPAGITGAKARLFAIGR